MHFTRRAFSLSSLALLAVPSGAAAQTRNATLRIIIPFPGGGSGDTLTVASYVTGFAPTADINTVLVVAAQAKVTGAPTWA